MQVKKNEFQQVYSIFASKHDFPVNVIQFNVDWSAGWMKHPPRLEDPSTGFWCMARAYSFDKCVLPRPV
jgi:hypothetical protein